MGKGTCRRFIISLPNIDFELGQLVKSLSADDLEDWRSKLTKAKETFLVRRHPPVYDAFLNWLLQATAVTSIWVNQAIERRNVRLLLIVCC